MRQHGNSGSPSRSPMGMPAAPYLSWPQGRRSQAGRMGDAHHMARTLAPEYQFPVAITQQSHSNHAATTQQSRSNHIASRPHSNHAATTQQSRTNQTVTTEKSRGNPATIIQQSHRNHIAIFTHQPRSNHTGITSNRARGIVRRFLRVVEGRAPVL